MTQPFCFWVYPPEPYAFVHPKSCARTLTAVLFPTATAWKLPGAINGEPIDKLCGIPAVEPLTPVRENHPPPFTATWRSLKV